MKTFEINQPTKIVIGKDSLMNLGQYAAQYGNKAILVTENVSGPLAGIYRKALRILEAAGVQAVHFDGVQANPTTDIVAKGAVMAREAGAQVVIGLGGGSSMDTAKAIAIEATHEGTVWDYLHYKKQPDDRTLPIIAVTTTSGTGSQATPCAVITKTEDKDKSAVWNDHIFPKIAIVDPMLMLSVPVGVTMQTGFDTFAHNFEAFLSVNGSLYTDTLALQGIRLAVENLPKLLEKPDDLAARESMALADTLGGIVIASAGVTLPHGLGMQISGHKPSVSHGQSLAVVYPEFTRFTWKYAVDKFAAAGRIFNPELNSADDTEAAKRCCAEIDGFLRKIGLWIDFSALGVTKEEIREIANDGQVLNDYKNNPVIASIEEMYDMLMNSYLRI